MWQEYPIHICLERLQYPCLWMLVIKYYSYYRKWKPKNHWLSVDAHFQDGVGTVSQSVMPINGARNSFLTFCNLSAVWSPRIQDQQLLTHCWCTFSRWGRERFTFSFNFKVCQSFIHDSVQPITTHITQNTLPTMVEAPLTLSVTTSSYYSNVDRSWPPTTSPISVNHGLQ